MVEVHAASTPEDMKTSAQQPLLAVLPPTPTPWTVNLIAMATPEDMKADAEHIRMADQFVEVR